MIIECNVMMETMIESLQPQARKPQSHQRLKEAGRIPSSRLQKDHDLQKPGFQISAHGSVTK
jgi:hypothetical protein